MTNLINDSPLEGEILLNEKEYNRLRKEIIRHYLGIPQEKPPTKKWIELELKADDMKPPKRIIKASNTHILIGLVIFALYVGGVIYLLT